MSSKDRPAFCANSRKRPTHALRSEVQLLQWTMATGRPAGVVTRSISGCTLLRPCSNTTMAKMLVPADTFPVRARTLLVAAMPVPASPSGGHRGMPLSRVPLGSKRAAPASVRLPASSPAVSTWGRMSASFQGRCSPAVSSSKRWILVRSKSRLWVSTGNMPAASPMPSTFRPVSIQCT